MYADLWSFALKMYTRPGVETACLNLQSDGANVCLLLCAAWLGQRGIAWSVDRGMQLQRLAEPWQAEVVHPLRQLRQQWRAAALQDSELMTLREELKGLELKAERQLLTRLEALARCWAEVEADSLGDWLKGVTPMPAIQNRDALQVLHVAATIV